MKENTVVFVICCLAGSADKSAGKKPMVQHDDYACYSQINKVVVVLISHYNVKTTIAINIELQ